MYKVEKNIPVPPKSRGTGSYKYPFAYMEVGDSFFVKNGNSKRISVSCRGYAIRKGGKFSCRTLPGGVRVWRIE
jgi:hypothetical protein